MSSQNELIHELYIAMRAPKERSTKKQTQTNKLIKNSTETAVAREAVKYLPCHVSAMRTEYTDESEGLVTITSYITVTEDKKKFL